MTSIHPQARRRSADWNLGPVPCVSRSFRRQGSDGLQGRSQGLGGWSGAGGSMCRAAAELASRLAGVGADLRAGLGGAATPAGGGSLWGCHRRSVRCGSHAPSQRLAFGSWGSKVIAGARLVRSLTRSGGVAWLCELLTPHGLSLALGQWCGCVLLTQTTSAIFDAAAIQVSVKRANIVTP